MKLRGLTPLLAASLAAIAFAATGCGSKSSSSSTPSAAPTTASTHTTTTTKKHQARTLKAGQFCSTAKESAYMAKGFTCVGGHLKKVGATAKHYKAGQLCSTRLAATYSQQGLVCKNGHLAKK